MKYIFLQSISWIRHRSLVFFLLFYIVKTIYSFISFFSVPFSLSLSWRTILDSIAMNLLASNRSMLISFFVLLDTDAFRAENSMVDIIVRSFLERILIVVFSSAKGAMNGIEAIILQRKYALKELQLLKSEIMVLRRIGTERNFLALKASLFVHMHAEGYARIQKLIFHFFSKRKSFYRSAQCSADL